MLALSGIIGLYIAGVLFGKRRGKMSGGSYVVLLLLAVVQAMIIIFDMYSRKVPLP
jgi:uncharacterized membrane protein YeaQ/YmgE (transglycosylase-associated protein family)